MTKAIKSLIKHAFNKLNLNRLKIKIASENFKSIAIAKRLNFQKEGALRQNEYLNDKFCYYIIHNLLLEDLN